MFTDRVAHTLLRCSCVFAEMLLRAPIFVNPFETEVTLLQNKNKENLEFLVAI